MIGSGEHTLRTDFHPQLTVIGGLSPSTREALAGELIDAMAGGRPGVHLEVRAGGRSLTVFRPETGRHRVIDTDAVRDVTEEHLGPDGEIDLFAAVGADRALARRTIRLTRHDLVPDGESDAWIARLAATDQEALWDTAMRCRAAERLLEQASAGGVSLDDAPIVREIEERHAALVSATDSYENIRLIALTIGTVGALGAIGVQQLERPGMALPFLMVALFGAVLALRYRRSVDDAARAERNVLRQAGADDYSSFHYERVSALLDTDHERRSFMRAVGDHRRAMTAWGEVAGAVPFAFAMDHERDVRAAAEMRAELGAHRSPTGDEDDGPDVSAELAQAILARVRAVRALTPEDTLPLVVDDPFDGLDAATKPVLLEMLVAQARNLQIIVVTADPDVVRWAQGEATRGRLALTGPTIAEGAIAAPAG